MTKFLALFFSFVLINISSAYADDRFVFSVSDDTPASFFTSGITGYYFRPDGVKIIHYADEKLIQNPESDAEGLYPYVSDIFGGAEGVIMNADGSVRLIRTKDDYSCVDNPLMNCLYSDMLITSFDVRNLAGKIDISAIDKNLMLKDKTLKFKPGAKIYSFDVVAAGYDFSSFTDIDSLVCSKDETLECVKVIKDGVLDMAALFDLSIGNGELADILYSYETDDLSYIYDFENMTVTPYSYSCLEESDRPEQLENCRNNKLETGIIKELVSKTGLTYWQVEFNNTELNDTIFFINADDEPFKVYTNNQTKLVLNMFNKSAAEAIASSYEQSSLLPVAR